MSKHITTKPFYNATIPGDWEVMEFGKLFEFKNGINASKESYGNGVKFINVMEVIYHNCITSDMIPGSVKISDKQLDDFIVRRGDVLFNRTSETTEEIGLAAVYLDDKKVVFGGFVIRGIAKDKSLHDEYKKYCFHSKFVRDQIIKGGQGAVRSNIGQGYLEKVKLPLPPLHEQKAIAHILSLMDTTINKNNLLIAKKEVQKKWLMQNLLTGKKRLKGFEGEWKDMKLADFSLNKSSSLSINNLEGNIGCYALYGANRAIQRINFYESEVPYVSIIKDGAGVGRVFLCEGKSSIVGTMAYIKPNSKSILSFLYYLLQMVKFKNFITGSTIPHIYYSDYSKIIMGIPSLQEQTAIAQVLQAADKEIQLLKDKTKKLREQKKGMMQVLLTGKKRLKIKID